MKRRQKSCLIEHEFGRALDTRSRSGIEDTDSEDAAERTIVVVVRYIDEAETETESPNLGTYPRLLF